MVHDRHKGHRHPLRIGSGAVASREGTAGTLGSMNALILATEAHVEPPGDEFETIAYAMLGAMMLVAAVVTWIVTPKKSNH